MGCGPSSTTAKLIAEKQTTQDEEKARKISVLSPSEQLERAMKEDDFELCGRLEPLATAYEALQMDLSAAKAAQDDALCQDLQEELNAFPKALDGFETWRAKRHLTKAKAAEIKTMTTEMGVAKSVKDFSRAQKVKAELNAVRAMTYDEYRTRVRNTEIGKTLGQKLNNTKVTQEILKLIEEGANIDVVDNNHRSALHKAAFKPSQASAYKGSADVVKILVDAGANLDLVDNINACSALHLAGGRADVVKILVDAKANLDLVTFKRGCSALHGAAEYSSADVVKILVDAGANLDLVDYQGSSALFRAARIGRADVVKILVDAKANLNLIHEDKEGLDPNRNFSQSVLDKENCWSALHGAANCSADVLKILVDAKAELDLVTRDGESALHFAAGYKGSANAVKILVVAEAKLDLVNKNGESALHFSAKFGRADVAKILVDAGVKPDLVNKDGKTPRQMATESKKGKWEEVVKLLDAHAAKGHVAGVE